ncbi:MAG: hypothetical protein II694_03660, partial [Lachnospiraceae bacterium]|nr:hypothetical protein [Lachnospiraceae bacterium]
MKKLEKLIALLLVVAMTFSLAACGKKSGEETPTNAPTQAPATTTAPTKPADSGSENFDGSGTDITETIEAD